MLLELLKVAEWFFGHWASVTEDWHICTFRYAAGGLSEKTMVENGRRTELKWCVMSCDGEA